jgi:hypothetical protein
MDLPGSSELEATVREFLASTLAVRPERLQLHTSLFQDLGVAGDDGADLLKDFALRFGVDVSHVDPSCYFGAEDSPVFVLFHWARRVFRRGDHVTREGQWPLTVGDLVEAARTGRLCLRA